MSLDTLYILLSIQYFFWAVVFLFVKKENKLANVFLGFYLLCHGHLFCYFYQSYSGNYDAPSIYTQLYWIPSALHNPLLFLYIAHYTKGKLMPKGKILLHTIPSLLVTAIFILYYLSLDYTGRVQLTEIHMSGESHNYLDLYLYTHIFLFGQTIFYLVLNSMHIYKYKKQILNFSANAPCERIAWIQQLIVFTLIINVGGFVVFDMISDVPMLRFYPAVHFTLIYYILYKAVNQSKIFETHSTDILENVNFQENYISNQAYEVLLQKATEYAFESDIYRDKNFDIVQLAVALGTQTSLLLDSIKHSQHHDFYTYANWLRVAAMQEDGQADMLTRKSVDELAELFGFTSEKTMLVFFKKHTGVSFLDYQSKLIHQQ